MHGESRHIVVLVASGTEEEAWRIAQTAVEQCLAACAQIFPIRSCYIWQGEVVRDTEHLIFLKSRRDRYEELETCIRSLHSYEIPEIIAIPIEQGLTAYLAWMDETLMHARGTPEQQTNE